MIASSVRLCLWMLCLACPAARACGGDTTALFACEAAGGRKFIELCAPSPLDATGFLEYRFGSLDKNGEERNVELEFPPERPGSLRRFYAATYTHSGIYTQSVRFVSADFGYTVYTKSKGMQTIDAGVEVRHRKSGKAVIVACSERPRFYIYDLKGLVGCDEQTPVGKACVK